MRYTITITAAALLALAACGAPPAEEPEEQDEAPQEEPTEDDSAQDDLMAEVEALVIADCDEWKEVDPSLDQPDFNEYCMFDPDAHDEIAVSEETGYVLVNQGPWGITNPFGRATLDLACGEIEGFEGVEAVDVTGQTEAESWHCDDERPAH